MGKPNCPQFYFLTSSNFVKISHKNYLDQVNSWKKSYGNSGMVYFSKKTQAPSPYSVLKHIERVAKPNLGPQNYLRYF